MTRKKFLGNRSARHFSLPATALIITALGFGCFSQSWAARPVDVQPAGAKPAKEIHAGARGGEVGDKAASAKPESGSPASAERIANGKKVFEKLTCAGCHPNGENSLHPYRPLKGPGFLARYKDDKQIEQLIRTGVLKAGMPSFSKVRLNDHDMLDLIAYIRSLTPPTAKK